MRKTTNLEHRVRILEARLASLDASIKRDSALADAHTQAELAVEYSQRFVRTVLWATAAFVGASAFSVALSYLST